MCNCIVVVVDVLVIFVAINLIYGLINFHFPLSNYSFVYREKKNKPNQKQMQKSESKRSNWKIYVA